MSNPTPTTDTWSVRGHAADRHDVPEVPIGHERGALGPARHVAQLGQRLRLVGPEDLRLGHTPLIIFSFLSSRGARSPVILSAAGAKDLLSRPYRHGHPGGDREQPHAESER